MSLGILPTLQKLSGKYLVRNEALTLSALDYLPADLFPLVFEAALDITQTNIMKEMVATWPHPCLCLGVMLKRRPAYLKILQAALDGLDKLLAQNVRPRRCKLQVLDLCTGPRNLWRVPSADSESDSENEAEAKDSEPRVNQPLKIMLDLRLKGRPRDQFVPHLLQWVGQRKDLLQLCFNKVLIWSLSFCNYKNIFQLSDPAHVKELSVFCTNNPSAFLKLTPYLGKMRNLCRLRLYHISDNIGTTPPATKRKIISQLASTLSKFKCLQKFQIDTVDFLEGHLVQLLGHLKSPLDSLTVTHCQFTESEWNLLPEFRCTSRLRHLMLSSVTLTHLSPEPLRVLLVNAADTLVSLELKDCYIGDSQLHAFLPALSQCSNLHTFNFCGSHIYMSTLKDLLHHTARLRRLSFEMYPFPQESYDLQGVPHYERLVQHHVELMNILKKVRQPRKVTFATDFCSQCRRRCVFDDVVSLCNCWNHLA